MFKQFSIKCSQCKKSLAQYLDLECSHRLCLCCLEQIVKANQRQQMLLDHLEIVCQVCNYTTQITVPLAYKLIRGLKNEQSQLKNSKTMVCLNCLDDFFTVEAYLNGEHQGHQVQSLQQCASLFKSILQYTVSSLEQNIDNLFKNGQKLIHLKNMLNDVLSANISKIQIMFEHLKEEIDRKEAQILDYYSTLVSQSFTTIDRQKQAINNHIQIGRTHLNWICSNVNDEKSNKCQNNAEIINYFLKNRMNIDAVHKFQRFFDQKMPTYLEIINLHKDNMKFQKLRMIKQKIKQIDLFEKQSNINVEKQQGMVIQKVQNLDQEYFQFKRIEVLNKPIDESKRLRQYFFKNSQSQQFRNTNFKNCSPKFQHIRSYKRY